MESITKPFKPHLPAFIPPPFSSRARRNSNTPYPPPQPPRYPRQSVTEARTSLRRISVPAKRNANIITNWAIMRRPIRRIRKRTGTRRRRRSAISMETSMIARREREPVRPKRVPVHLADIIAHLSGARVCILELQDRLRDFAVLETGFQASTVVGTEVRFAVGACARGEHVDCTAGGCAAVVFALSAYVEVDGFGAVVANVGGSERAGCGVDGGDGGAACDERGVADVAVIGCYGAWVGHGEGGDGEVAHGYKGRDGEDGEMHFVLIEIDEDRSCW